MYRVLIADDEPIERAVICKTIEKIFENQLEIVQAVNGREAIELFEAKKFHIVILDIEMPGINGLEAAEKIREYDEQCNIIFLTAMDDFKYAKKAITVKALEYLLKPSSEEEITAVIEEAIRAVDRQKEDTTKVHIRNKYTEIGFEKSEHIRIHAIQAEILKFIKKHYLEGITMQDAAEAMNYSNAYFCKIFRQGFDKSFTLYLSEYRIEKAKQFLADVTINVKEVSEKVGYNDSNYFTKVFKRIVGVTPSEYRMIVLGK